MGYTGYESTPTAPTIFEPMEGTYEVDVTEMFQTGTTKELDLVMPQMQLQKQVIPISSIPDI